MNGRSFEFHFSYLQMHEIHWCVPFKHLFAFKISSFAYQKNTCTCTFDLSFDLLQLEVKLKSYNCKVYTLISISPNNQKKRILFPTMTTTTTATTTMVSNLNINRGIVNLLNIHNSSETNTTEDCERDFVFEMH